MIILSAIFTDHAVLQQGKKAAVWGETDGSDIEVILMRKDMQGETVCSVKAVTVPVPDAESKVPPVAASESFDEHNRKAFLAYLEPQEPGGPYSILIRENKSPAGSGSEIILNDIWFGEVFLAGGQSNMELNLINSRNGKEEVAASFDPNVRFYCTPKVAYVGEELYGQERTSVWTGCNPETSYYQSAIGYYFARDLSRKLGRMVGIINCNWGGTSATCWISRETTEAHPELMPYLEAYDRACSGQTEEEYLKALEEYRIYDAEFNRKLSEYYATAQSPNWNDAIKVCGECRYPGPMGPRTWCRPNGLYESMLRRVAPYTLAGFLFYQAEEDDNRPFTYAKLLPVLMRAWRDEWKDPELPFLLVQLPGYNGEDEQDLMNWPIIREIQQNTAKSDANCAMAVTIDLGHRTNVHPLDKKPVGERLSLQAQYLLYGMLSGEKASGPVFDRAEFHKGRADVYFENADEGFDVKIPGGWNAYNPDEAGGGHFEKLSDTNLGFVTGFELAGQDRIYHEAVVTKSTGNVITVESPRVDTPVYVRYLWRNFAEVTLYGVNGIPVAPFRSNADDKAMPLGSRQGRLLE
ncbi:MAG: sialate O-acetylesterase [Lachnospiraceae bacterium]|nr:sialate O-acetylesterase [Lachnospiraceae bacterium]